MADKERGDFSVRVWVRAEHGAPGYNAIATDKTWEGGQVVDFLSRQNSGLSLDSGLQPGWALILRPDGAWGWNLGDGQQRLDYLPTARVQNAADGQWHMLAFTVNAAANEARLYRDGIGVALYSLAGLSNWRGGEPARIGCPGAEVRDLRVNEGVVPAAAIEAAWCRGGGRAVPAAPAAPRQLRVMTWNIWNGGREDGVELGVERTAQIIAAAGADMVAMQETYGSGPLIADALGFHFYWRSSNLSILSRFPIASTHDVWDDPFRLGGVTLELGGGRSFRLFTLWIHYLPDFCSEVQRQGVKAAELVAAEEETRGPEIRSILRALEPFIEEADSVPLVVAGDFNSPSHLDWTEATRERHCGLALAWPVSLAMQQAGFADAYRHSHPDPLRMPGRTWTPRSPQAWQDRIDYIYYRGRLRCIGTEVVDEHAVCWPSDHAAVLAILEQRGDSSKDISCLERPSNSGFDSASLGAKRP